MQNNANTSIKAKFRVTDAAICTKHNVAGEIEPTEPQITTYSLVQVMQNINQTMPYATSPLSVINVYDQQPGF